MTAPNPPPPAAAEDPPPVEAAPPTPKPGPPPVEAAPPTPKPGPPPAAPEPADTGEAKPSDWKIEDQPEGVQRHIRELRDENAKRRTGVEQRVNEATTKASEQARNDLAQQIGKALGLIKDDDVAPDPAKLAAQLTAERDQAATDLRNERVNNAAYQAAANTGANPAALIDSQAFLNAAHLLDPTSDTFTTDLAAAIKAATEANPHLRAIGQAPPRSVTEPTGGTGGTGGTPTSGIEAYRERLKQRAGRT